jgi:beta-N-acetylhexosaminidase
MMTPQISIETLIRKHSLEELVGQLFMVGFQGTRYNSDLTFLLKKLHVGGIILFKRNIQDPWQTAQLTRDLQEKALEASSLPLFVAVDQEGGEVSRLDPPFTQWPGQSFQALSENPEETVRSFARTTAEELKLVGINLNLAPVLDVNTRGADGLMARRSYGADPFQVARLGGVCISELQQSGIMACAKHFPGIGATELDSHQDLPILLKDRPALEEMELIPFREVIPIPPAAIMVTHVHYPALDPRWPAGLSQPIVMGLLRQEMGYQGVVLSDDLEMGAIGKHFEIEEAASLAFQAGVDGLLICQDPEKIERAYRYLLKGLKKGSLPESLLKEALRRIFALKQTYLRRPFPDSEKEILDYFSSRSTR